MATKPKPTTKRKAVSVRVSKKKRGISKLQAIVLVAVLAIIGVVAVALTRASGTPPYQYSYSTHCKVAADTTKARQDAQACKDRSAEAMVYRLYRGLMDRDPNATEYAFWTQQLAGERTKITDTVLVQKQSAAMGSDEVFISKLYNDMLLRAPKGNELKTWKARLVAPGDKKWSRQKVVGQFATTIEAVKANRLPFKAFSATAPVVTVTQTAAAEQRKRYETMLTDYQQPNWNSRNKAKDAANKANKLVTTANDVAGKSSITLADLDKIGDYQDLATGYLANARSYAAEAKGRVSAANRPYDQARALAAHARDIAASPNYGISMIKARYNTIAGYYTEAAKTPTEISSSISKISKAYSSAEKKYQSKSSTGAGVSQPEAACSASECGSPKTPAGATVAQMDALWENFCNAQPNKREKLTPAAAGSLISHANALTVTRDIFYKKDNLHRRSCMKGFTEYDLATLQCISGYFPDGPYCSQYTSPDKGKQCPGGFFAARGYCWSNEKSEYARGQSCSAVGLTFYQQANKNGTITNICRRRKVQYAGY